MSYSSDNISRLVKTLGIVNLTSILFVWIPLAPCANGFEFQTLDNLFTSIFLLWLFYSLQGVLVFMKGKWDNILASTIVVFSISFWIIFDEFRFLIATAPMALYLILQLKSNAISDNIKLTYLNIWNVLILIFVAVDFWRK